jgi:hypothetical protein
MLDAGGGGGEMYAVQIESLETFQQKLTSILQSLEQDNTVMSMNDASSVFGDFAEAQEFSMSYEQTKQDLINSFNEVTQLVNTMISVVGSNANKYKQTEQDVTAKFNAILQQYGDAPTPGGTAYYPQTSGTTTGKTYATRSSATAGTPTTPAQSPSPAPTATPTTTPTPAPTTTNTGNTSAGAA